MSARRLTISALFMAITLILSASFLSVPVPGGHFYMNGIIIILTGLIFPPVEAVLVAGIGSFLGDFFFYPAPMFVTLVTHGLQVFIMSMLVGEGQSRKLSRQSVWFAMITGAVITILGYGLGRTFLYANLQYALLKLPFDILAMVLSMIVVDLIYFKTSLVADFYRYWNQG